MAARATPTSRRCAASSRSSTPPPTSCPATARSIDGARAAAILREDLNYLAKLPDAELPMARRGAAQRAIHAENVKRVTSGRVVIQHVALEVREADVDACVAFWALLGFARVPAPEALAARSTWVQAGDTQIHLLYADAPVVPPEGHVAVDRRRPRGHAGRAARRRLRPAAAHRVLGLAARLRPLSGGPSRRAHGLRARPLRPAAPGFYSLTSVLRKPALNLRIVDILVLP